MEILKKDEASALGLKRYFTGIPCKRGHVVERLISTGTCLNCDKISSEKYRLANPEICKERVKNSVKKRPDKYTGTSNEWRKANFKKAQDMDLNYRKRNPNKVNDWVKDNREKSRAIKKKWALENPGLVLANLNKRRAKKLKANVNWANQKIINKIYITCSEVTKNTGVSHHVNHIIPLQGKYVCGLHVENNLEIITAEENLKLGNKHESDNWQN